MKKIIGFGSISLLGMPLLTSAQDAGYVTNLIEESTGLLGKALVFLISLAIVWFIFNVVKYAMSSDDGEKDKAKGQMIYGIIAIAVIVSVWGLVAILQNMFGVSTKGASSSSTFEEMIPLGN